MSKKIQEIASKLMYLEKINPLKLAEFKGRLDAIYEMEGCDVKCESISTSKGRIRTDPR